MDDLGNKIVYEFPIGRWFAIDEDDGKIQRDVLVGASQPTGEENDITAFHKQKSVDISRGNLLVVSTIHSSLFNQII